MLANLLLEWHWINICSGIMVPRCHFICPAAAVLARKTRLSHCLHIVVGRQADSMTITICHEPRLSREVCKQRVYVLRSLLYVGYQSASLRFIRSKLAFFSPIKCHLRVMLKWCLLGVSFVLVSSCQTYQKSTPSRLHMAKICRQVFGQTIHDARAPISTAVAKLMGGSFFLSLRVSCFSYLCGAMAMAGSMKKECRVTRCRVFPEKWHLNGFLHLSMGWFSVLIMYQLPRNDVEQLSIYSFTLRCHNSSTWNWSHHPRIIFQEACMYLFQIKK